MSPPAEGASPLQLRRVSSKRWQPLSDTIRTLLDAGQKFAPATGGVRLHALMLGSETAALSAHEVARGAEFWPIGIRIRMLISCTDVQMWHEETVTITSSEGRNLGRENLRLLLAATGYCTAAYRTGVRAGQVCMC